MASFNQVTILGNLTRDVEVRFLQNGTAVTDIDIAINDKRKDKSTGEMIENTTFVPVTLWGRTAEIASEYLGKGSPCLVTGRLQQDTWNDKETGDKRSKMKVVGDRLVLLGKRDEASGSSEYSEPMSQQQSQPATQPAAQPAADGDIPFSPNTY